MSADKPTSTRGITASIELRDELADASWNRNLSRSDIVRAAIEKFLEDPTQLAGWGGDPGSGTARITFIISDEQWGQVAAAARVNRKSVAAAIRIALQKELNG